MAMSAKAKKVYEEVRRHVMDAVVPLSDADYLEVLENLSCDVDSAVEAKREEMGDDD